MKKYGIAVFFALVFICFSAGAAWANPGDASDEMVEIGVQFRTPPAVALRHMLGNNMARDLSGISYENLALQAHTRFFRELEILPQPFFADPEREIKIRSEHSSLFNGVFMRVPAYMVEVIAGFA